MQQENKHPVPTVIFAVLSVLCMVMIFYFSSQSAGDSDKQSSIILEIVRRIFGNNSFSNFLVRKAAHFCEFALLGMLFNFTYYFYKNSKNIILSTSLASLYAASDEIHQIFVEGRSCQFRDWAIDTGGAITGMAVFLVIYLIINKVTKHKEI